jgi:hypothetical protein
MYQLEVPASAFFIAMCRDENRRDPAISGIQSRLQF